MITKKLGNSRLLYVVQNCTEADVNEALSQIDNFILSSRQVELARDVVIIIPDERDLWIGREVSGYPTELADPIEMKDFNSQEVFEEAVREKFDQFSRLLAHGQSRALELNAKLHRIVMDIDHFERPWLQFIRNN